MAFNRTSKSAPERTAAIALATLTLLGSLIFLAWQFLRPRSVTVAGDWSELGKCESHRFRFTHEGSYVSLKRDSSSNSGEWQKAYSGVYVFKEDVLIIGENPNTGGFALRVVSLTENDLVGEMDSSPIRWVRCN